MKTTFNLSEAEKRNKGNKARLMVLFLIIFLSGAAVGETYGQGVAIGESEPITPDPSSILDLQSTERGFLVPRMTTDQREAIVSPATGLLVFDTDRQSFWYYDDDDNWKEIAATFLGTPNQLLGMNNAGDANEYKTLSSEPNIIITHTAGDISLNTAQNIQTTSSPTFNSLTLNGSLSANSVTISGIFTAGTVNGRNVAWDGMNLDSLQKLTGVVAGSANFGTGTFTGSIISDNATIKSALQELETRVESYPALSFDEDYLKANVALLANDPPTAVTSIMLEPGTWMITSETTIASPVSSGTWNATVFIGTASNSAYTSGQSSAPANGVIAISLSRIVTLTSNETVSVFVTASEAAIVIHAPPSNLSIPETATAIHAIRVK